MAEEAVEDVKDIGAIEHKHEVGPELGEVAGPAAVKDEPEEHFQRPPTEPRYPKMGMEEARSLAAEGLVLS